MTKKKTVASRSTALVPITGTALAPILDSNDAVERLPGVGGSFARDRGVTLVTDRPYATRDRVVPASEIYFVDEAKPSADGPWLGEADKVAWRDEASGYECIMLRDRHESFLSGYVGVPREHPLWGWDHEAVSPALGIAVHGGLTYSEICQDGPSPTRDILVESRRICHVPATPPKYGPIDHASDYRVDDPHAFWFGFDCNHIYDIVPNARSHRRQFLSAETAAEYRDDTYVVREIVNLAAQLKAIADGTLAPGREGPPLPPIGLDPQRGG
ncbi:hypothetical protein OKW76_12530 [Sphingomonas sp. S1-29]|uniref:hypothetical protein n=1 Tax=Sphingomonas sp. S1-29 TaxID=2991074 RepID=UPI0022406692|nr:hypothetical protein [Sphingomonas sp. S1-29]UZK68855.1 hypothetical protein OKW76_12530 [Sphingomonas sp. S1-29]